MSSHILLIDDDQDEFDLLKIITHELSPSLKVSYANSGSKGIAILRTGIADAVLLDMNMPIMNGYECMQEIMKDGLLKGIPLYIYSTSITHPLSLSALKLGAAGFIKKPRTMDGLRDIVRQHFLTPAMAVA